MVPVYIPSIRPSVSPTSIHKDFETGSGVLTEQRNTLSSTSTTCSFYTRGQVAGAHSNSVSSARSTGISSELSQVHARPKPSSGVSGLHNQLHKEVDCEAEEFSLPVEKVKKLVAEVRAMLECHTVSARSLAQLNVTFTLFVQPGIACSCKAALAIPRLWKYCLDYVFCCYDTYY